ncbi:OmpA family protein [Saccharopolyspora rhizosphaerae]|uniref:OmpA family protein n=1 Tax=Saccharopolyspora rhizosphaerae TaxID=2492662 RepID=UPI001315091D|nr:OmpA family protein [Saccharopolyspora rhizosphaerae]
MIACTSALLAGCGGGQEGGTGMPSGAPAPPPPAAGEQQPGGMGTGEQGGGEQDGGDAAQAKEQLQGQLDQLNQASPITFDPDSSELSDQGRDAVTKFAEVIKAAPQDMKFTVSGFTASGTNSDQDSQQLSQERAQAVADQLTQAGAPADRLQVSGQGDAEGDPGAARKVEVSLQ